MLILTGLNSFTLIATLNVYHVIRMTKKLKLRVH